MVGANQRHCPMCRNTKDLDSTHFKAKRNGEFSTNCLDCLIARRRRHARTKESSSNKENTVPEEDEGEDDDESIGEDEETECSRLSVLELADFLDAISAVEEIHSFTARVNTSSLNSEDLKERSNRLAKSIWDNMDYRFMYIQVISFIIR